MSELTIESVRDFLSKNKLQLYPTQCEVSLPILIRIHKRLKQGKVLPAIHIDNDVIVNGHHRYICHNILGMEVERIPWKKSPSVPLYEWHKMEVREEDWDDEEKKKKFILEYDLPIKEMER